MKKGQQETSCNPLLVNVPEEFDSPRLIIRAPQAGEGAALNEAILETWEDLHNWLPWADKKPTVEESELNVRQARIDFLSRKEMRLQLWHKENGELVGSSGLHRIDWRVPRFEIGYWCRAKYQGQGFIQEATEALTRMAFEKLGAKRVEIRCDPKNEKSTRIPERLGFTLEGHMKQQFRDVQGTLRDILIYARLENFSSPGKENP